MEIVTLPGGQLLVAELSDRLFGFAFLAPALLLAAFLVYRCFRSGSLFPLWGLLLCLPFALVGMRVMVSGSLTLDRAASTATFRKPSWVGLHSFTVPLGQIDHAEVRGRVQSDYIAVVLKSGDDLLFTDSNQKPGKGQAAKAINDYVGYSR